MRSSRKREEVLLVAVTKTHPAEVVRSAYDLGLRHFGENRVQELVRKKEELPEDILWHLIGHLQSNKAKYVAPFVHLVHSIDSLETAKELSKRAEQHNRTVPVLIEVNVSNESSKHGIQSGQLFPILEGILREAPFLELHGLMTVAAFEENPEQVRPQFINLRKLLEESRSRYPELTAFKELSMGMSNDFEVAIEEGATIVRVGSALFGERD